MKKKGHFERGCSEKRKRQKAREEGGVQGKSCGIDPGVAIAGYIIPGCHCVR